jgi:predicted Zn-dependent peptidase
MKIILNTIIMSVLFVGILNAQTFFVNQNIDRSQEPKPGKLFSMELPKIERAKLKNGLNILIVEHRELPVVQLQLVIKTGAEGDPKGKAGLANLTADMLDEGTKKRSALQIADDLDFIGARVSTSANFDGSLGSLLTLKEHLSSAMDIFSDIILNSKFPQSEFDRLKSELLTDLLAQKVRPDIIATNIFNQKLFGSEHPYSQNLDGNEESVSNINIEDVKIFYDTYYSPNNASLIVVGDITKNEAIKMAEKYFGKWKKKDVVLPIVKKPEGESEPRIYIVHKEDAPQSQIRVGNIGIERNNTDFYAVNILNQILGASNGRLFLNLREAKGYTYGAYAYFAMMRYPGPFLAYAGVKTDVTDSSIIEFMKEINRVRDELVPEDEFEMYKTAVIQRLPRVFETPAQIAGQLMAIELFNLPEDYFSTLIEKYKRITREDIRYVANKYLHPEIITIVVVGDKNAIKEKIERLGYGRVIICDEKGKEL